MKESALTKSRSEKAFSASAASTNAVSRHRRINLESELRNPCARTRRKLEEESEDHWRIIE
jgi:hypothetical protein